MIQQVCGISLDTSKKDGTAKDFKFDKFRVNDIGATSDVIELRREIPIPHFGTRATYNCKWCSDAQRLPKTYPWSGKISVKRCNPWIPVTTQPNKCGPLLQITNCLPLSSQLIPCDDHVIALGNIPMQKTSVFNVPPFVKQPYIYKCI